MQYYAMTAYHSSFSFSIYHHGLIAFISLVLSVMVHDYDYGFHVA